MKLRNFSENFDRQRRCRLTGSVSEVTTTSVKTPTNNTHFSLYLRSREYQCCCSSCPGTGSSTGPFSLVAFIEFVQKKNKRPAFFPLLRSTTVKKLKAQPPTLVFSRKTVNLIQKHGEYRIWIHPVILSLGHFFGIKGDYLSVVKRKNRLASALLTASCKSTALTRRLCLVWLRCCTSGFLWCCARRTGHAR